MGLIDQIVQGYQDSGLTEIIVPEWSTSIYYKETTPLELDTAKKAAPEDASPSRFYSQLVCIKALDAEGKRIFKNADIEKLARYGSSGVISRIALQMSKTPTVEDAEKNLLTNQN